MTLAGLTPGAPLAAATALADALDARRVPLTLLAAPRPHPEVAAWVGARRRAGDAVLLYGTRPEPGTGRPYRRLPAHEAGLRLAGALRAVEACSRDVPGAGLDGFAAPGWDCSEGVRRALAAAGLDLLVDDDGVHRLGPDGLPRRSHRAPRGLVHVRGTVAEGGPHTTEVVRLVDRALAAGALPTTASALPAPRRAPAVTTRADVPDPEHWSITA